MDTCNHLVYRRLERLVKSAISFLLIVIGVMAAPGRCRAWGPDGHQITAYIAADHLTPAARRNIARILDVPDDPAAVAKAMAQAAIRPDADFRTSAPETLEWHFINFCRQDTPAQEQARCAGGNCLTARIKRFVHDLRSRKKDDKWDSAAQLAFVINFMGEIHQPLHAITNADMGGKCLGVISPEPAKALHSLWGERMVRHVEQELHTHGPAETAAALERRFPDAVKKSPAISDIAWESHQLAESEAYQKLGIPLQPCQPTACIKRKKPLKISQDYLDRESIVVQQRLATGGYRLAALLNSIWKNS